MRVSLFSVIRKPPSSPLELDELEELAELYELPRLDGELEELLFRLLDSELFTVGDELEELTLSTIGG